jgi:hypothetical protein
LQGCGHVIATARSPFTFSSPIVPYAAAGDGSTFTNISVQTGPGTQSIAQHHAIKWMFADGGDCAPALMSGVGFPVLLFALAAIYLYGQCRRISAE